MKINNKDALFLTHFKLMPYIFFTFPEAVHTQHPNVHVTQSLNYFRENQKNKSILFNLRKKNYIFGDV